MGVEEEIMRERGVERSLLRSDSLGRGTVHFDAVADLQELDAEAGGFKTSAGAHFVEILIILEKKFLGFAAGAQRAAAPVFNRHHDNGRPETAFPDRPFDNPML
jgi:hypothetical protein